MALLMAPAAWAQQTSDAPEVKYRPGAALKVPTTQTPSTPALTKWPSKKGLRNPARRLVRKPRPVATVKRADGTSIIFWGNVIGQSSWNNLDPSDYPFGVYQFRGADPMTLDTLAMDENLDANGSGAFYDGAFHFISYQTVDGVGTLAQYFEYSTTTWKMTRSANIDDLGMIGISTAYDPETGNVYGTFYDSDMANFNFGYVNYTTLDKTTIKILQSYYWAMAINNEGDLYAITTAGNLVKVDKETGEETTVGSTGLQPNYQQSMTFDPVSDKLYWAASFSSKPAALYEVDTNTGAATKVADFPDDEEISCLYIPDAENTAGVPAKVSDLTFDFPNGSLTGTVSFTLPTKSSLGENLPNTDLTWTLIAGDKTFTGTGRPGTTVSQQMTLTKGETTFTVTTSSDAGTSPSTIVTKWIGEDRPQRPKNLQYTFDDQTGAVNLTWERPDGGMHGGWVDYDNMVYNVYRDGSLKSRAQKATSYKDTLDVNGELDYHYYEVTAKNNPDADNSERAYTENIITGQPIEPDWTTAFDSKNDFRLWTILDANNDGYTWAYMSNGSTKLARALVSETNASDDWFFSPPIHLEPDRFYKLGFKARRGLSGYAEKFSVAFGAHRTPADMKQELLPETVLPETADFTSFEEEFSVATEGTYYIGFHATSDPGNFAVYLDDVSIKKGVTFDAPDTVKNLTVTAGAEGAYEATVAFNAPTTNIRGEQLTSLTKVEIWKDNKVVKTFDNPAPGAALSFTDTDVSNGAVAYSVAATNATGTGLRTSASAWVGYDTPKEPENITLKDNLDGTLTLSWQTPGTVGTHGGYVDNTELTYKVYDVDLDNGETTIHTDNISGNTATLTDVNLEGTQDLLYFAVSAVSDLGEGDQGLSNIIIKGTPYELPYTESLSWGRLRTGDFWWVETSASDTPDWGVSDEISADDDGGCAVWEADQRGQWASFNSGKIALQGKENPQLMFSYYAMPGKDVLLTVTGYPAGKEAEDVDEVYFKNITASGWQRETVDLNAVKDAPYTMFKFRVLSNELEVPVALDDFLIMDVHSDNLAATIASPTAGNVGKSVDVNVTVESLGSEPTGDYTVDLYANNRLVESKTGEKLNMFDTYTYTFEYSPKIEDVGETKIHAVVNYAKDKDLSDNTTADITMIVNQPELPAVTTLVAEKEGTGVKLSWQQPATLERTISEDFESYAPWSIYDIGDWKLVDGDGLYTTGVMGFDWEHLGEKQAWIVFDPYECGLWRLSRYLPHSGNQYLACWSAQAAEGSTDASKNDDWLISPELAGDAQTISLWAKGASLTYTPETFEICYSTTTDDVSAFSVLATYNPGGEQWREFTADLPEGTKYFAIHCTSEDKLGLFVDDILYYNGQLTIDKYNVYRDGKLISNTASDRKEYLDVAPTDGAVYNVTVVYPEGESVMSNDASVLDAIKGATANSGITIAAARGMLRIMGAANKTVRVYTVAGASVYQGMPAESLSLRLPRGQYLVAVGTQKYNVVVR